MEEKILHQKSHKRGKCAYCGDSPVNHTFSYIGNALSIFFDFIFGWALRGTPKFLVRGVEKFLKLCLEALVFLKVIKLSSDPTKAVSLRSKVMWEEALRRGIPLQQLVIFGKYTDNYCTRLKGKNFYFNSLPIVSEAGFEAHKWDDKFFIKARFSAEDLPVPRYAPVPFFSWKQKSFFKSFHKPLIVKPRVGSRARHTTTNIRTFEEFEKAVKSARVLSPQVVAEEYLEGYICRATCVQGKLAGFFRAEGASVMGNGVQTLRELIEDKNKKRGERMEPIEISSELTDFISRQGFTLEDVLPAGFRLSLSHRTGRFFGGSTREMIDELHPSFLPILERASQTTGLPVVGLDCVIPDPEKSANDQRWGIIECNTLPFIDLHYYALEGKPRNIAGLIWDQHMLQ